MSAGTITKKIDLLLSQKQGTSCVGPGNYLIVISENDEALLAVHEDGRIDFGDGYSQERVDSLFEDAVSHLDAFGRSPFQELHVMTWRGVLALVARIAEYEANRIKEQADK